MKDKIKIGWSEIDITPHGKISLSGQFYERITDTVESPISVTGLAVESGSEQMIICSCDLGAIGKNLNEAVKERLKSRLPISPDKVILCAIHDHTSYSYLRKGNDPDDSTEILQSFCCPDTELTPQTQNNNVMTPEAALELLTEAITDAAVAAWENRLPAYYANAFGRAVVGMCRRICYTDGSARMWGDSNQESFSGIEGGNDSGIELIYTFDKDKKPTGVIANIACPAQVMEHRSVISADYWGKIKDRLRRKYGRDFKVLGLCSAAGDQCPRDMVRWVEPENPINDPNMERLTHIERRADPSMFDVEGANILGRRVANEIITVFEESRPELKDEGLLIHETVNLSLPLRRVSEQDYQDAVAHIRRFAEEHRDSALSFEDDAAMFVYAGTVSRYKLQKTVSAFSNEVHFIRFGDIAIVTNPFELFLDYGNQIRARSLAKQTFIIQLACGADGYLPTEKAERGGHYSAYVSSGTVGHEGGKLLVEETLKYVNAMFKD